MLHADFCKQLILSRLRYNDTITPKKRRSILRNCAPNRFRKTGDIPTPKERSTVLGCNDVESELGGLSAKANLREAQGLLFRCLEYALVVGLLRGQDMK